ncbi:hypothetical protein FHW58_003750 [Duganella sp. 1224]|uniref:hypothetical protein n=1 Tax=Duganella sp. 1224 TaxID=2587052 RepID=UPI0015C78B8A|nr:hypothetical protein [Duganella sp. 1224]NYE62531.1 hypothetical protein [Duganella sp. 1224]
MAIDNRPVIKRRRNRRYAGDRGFLCDENKTSPVEAVCLASPVYRRFMVYPKDVDIKIVVVVNTDTFLWITGHFELESGVYEVYKAARKPCMSEELFWDKKSRPNHSFVYSHLAPVDIHKLIHSPEQEN